MSGTPIVLVIDAGTSGVRAAAVDGAGAMVAEERIEVLPSSPAGGLVELDATALAAASLQVAGAVLDQVGEIAAVGVTDQRATTLIWDADSGEPLGPGLGWQDLRTVGRCLELRAEGIRIAPNHSATKAEWLLSRAEAGRNVRIGTVDSWLTWTLTGGACHVTDATNAQVTGLYDPVRRDWDDALLTRLGIPRSAMADIVDSTGVVGAAAALGLDAPVAALVGDQQGSLIGQGCIRPGDAKLTFGTGGMLDVCLGPDPGPHPEHGTFPIIGWRAAGSDTWAREAVMLAAGSCVEWLRDGLGLVDDAAQTAEVAGSVPDTDGVVFVPALSGLGTPVWDHGARGALFGLTRGTTRAHVVRAVLEGVAHRGADLLEAIEADTGARIERLRIDGGMSANAVFVRAVADATGRPVEVSAQREATAMGAAFLAGAAVGVWTDLADAATTIEPAEVVEPGEPLDRHRFREARDRSAGWIPALSALDL